MKLTARDLQGMGSWEAYSWKNVLGLVNSPIPAAYKTTEFAPYLEEARDIARNELVILQGLDRDMREQIFSMSKAVHLHSQMQKMRQAAYQGHMAKARFEKGTPIKRPIYLNQYQQALLKAENAILNLRLIAHRTRGGLKRDQAEIPL